MFRRSITTVVACLALVAGTSSALAQVGTSVTYQGQLKNAGVAVNSPSDIRYSLWDAATGGAQVGTTDTKIGVAVSQGLFSTTFDCGVNPYTADNALWLQIDVRSPSNTGGFVPLGARQQMTAAPFSLATRGLNVDESGIPRLPSHDTFLGDGTAATSLILDDIPTAKWKLYTTDYRLSFLNDSDGQFDPKMVINNNGNVGIGIGMGDAAERLEVNGNIRVADIATIGGRQGDQVTGILNIQAPGTLVSNPAFSRGGTIRLIAGNCNASAGFQPPLGTALDNNIQLVAGTNTFSGSFGTSFTGNIMFFAGYNQQERMRLVGDNGELLIGTTEASSNFLVDVGGNMRCVGLTQTSCRDLKQDIHPLTGALDSIMKLNPVSYAWNDKAPEQVQGKHDIGFIADEMNEVLPDIVAKDEHGKPVGIDYGKITPVAVEAIKQLKNENDRMKADNADLKAHLERLEALVAARVTGDSK